MALSKSVIEKLNKDLKSGKISAKDYATQYSQKKAVAPVLERQVDKYKATTINPVKNEVPSVVEAPVEKPVDTLAEQTSVKDRIAQEKRNLAINRFKSAFNTTSGRLSQEKAGLTPQYRNERALIGVQDTMNRTAAEKSRAMGGLSMSGARGQEEIAQNVITGNRMSDSQARESEQRADIERRLSEAVNLREQGIATAESEADIANLTNQLKDLEAAQARAYDKADTAEQRAYNERLTADERQYKEKQAATQREQELADINSERLYNLTRDEINRASDKEILEMKQNMDKEMAYIDSAIRQAETSQDFALQNQLYEKKYALEANNDILNNDARMAEIEAKKVEGETAPEEEKYSISTLKSSVKNYIADRDDKSAAVTEWLADLLKSNEITKTQANSIMREYNVSENDLGQMIFNLSR